MRTLKTLIFTTFIALSGFISVPATAQETATYSQAELDQMLAPIALYPDTVLSNVLIAATYPLEVVQAARWTRDNPGYSGEDAVAMVANQDWDPSVKALVAFPDLLDRMDKDLGWTQGLGDAFLAQEGEVTDTIQYLRNQAYDNGQLQSNAQVNVVRETKYIYIEPAQPQVVYVPYYDPRVVYGAWRWAAYPPVYWNYPPGFSVSLGFYWGIGYHIRPSFFYSSFYWPSRYVVVVNNHYHNSYRNYGHGKGHGGYRPGYNMAHYDGANRWQHNSQHRRGVSYRGDINQDRFSQRDGGGSRDHSAPVRTAQVKGKQRAWADQQRTRFANNAGNNPGNRSNGPLRGDRSRDFDSGQRPARLDSARDHGRAAPDRSAERVRQDLANSDISRRSNPQPAEPRSTPRANQEKSNRSALPAPARQLAVERRGQNANPAGGMRAGSATRDRRVTSPAMNANPRRETLYAAAAPQRSQQQRAEPQREATPSREAAPVRQARVERVSKPERAAQGQRSAPRPAAGKNERSNQNRESKAHKRSSRD